MTNAVREGRAGAKPVFVNTDVFLRFLIRDIEGPYQRARELFERAEAGLVKLETTVLVISALVEALSAYGLGQDKVKEILTAILNTRNLRVQNRELIEEAIGLLGRSVGFPDAYAAVHMKRKGLTQVATFLNGSSGIGAMRELYWKDAG